MRAMTLAIVGVALVYVTPLESQAPVQAPVDPRTAVQRTLIDLYRAISDGDAARFRTLCTRDFQRLDRSELMNIDRAIASFTSSVKSEPTRTDRLVFRSTRVVGNTASVVYVRTSTVKRRWKRRAEQVGRERPARSRCGEMAGFLAAFHLILMSHRRRRRPQSPKDPLPPWTKSLPVAAG